MNKPKRDGSSIALSLECIHDYSLCMYKKERICYLWLCKVWGSFLQVSRGCNQPHYVHENMD